MTCNLKLQLFGPIHIENNGAKINGFESQKAVALVGYLVYIGQPVPRSKLANLFWGNKTEARALSNLSRVLHNNNKLLPGCIETGYKTVQIKDSCNPTLDTNIFNELESKGDVNSLISAIKLYKGDFFEGISLIECPEFELWLIREQERWQQEVAKIHFDLISILIQQRDYSDAMNYASHLLTLDPWREEAHRSMMLILALNGQRLAALQQYKICYKILEDDLGVEPSEETKTLYDRILKGKNVEYISLPEAIPIPVTGSHPNNLPSNLPPLNGSESELSLVLERIENPLCRMLTLVGDGNNTRKDHIAHHVAAKEMDKFQHGVFYYALPQNNVIEFLCNALTQSFHFYCPKGNRCSETLFSFFRDKEILLITSNVIDSSPVIKFLEGILKRSPNVKIITTAPHPLGLPDEWIFEVSDDLTTDEIDLNDTIQREA